MINWFYDHLIINIMFPIHFNVHKYVSILVYVGVNKVSQNKRESNIFPKLMMFHIHHTPLLYATKWTTKTEVNNIHMWVCHTHWNCAYSFSFGQTVAYNRSSLHIVCRGQSVSMSTLPVARRSVGLFWNVTVKSTVTSLSSFILSSIHVFVCAFVAAAINTFVHRQSIVFVLDVNSATEIHLNMIQSNAYMTVCGELCTRVYVCVFPVCYWTFVVGWWTFQRIWLLAVAYKSIILRPYSFTVDSDFKRCTSNQHILKELPL